MLSLSVTAPPNTIPLTVTDPPTGTFSLTVDTADVVTLAVSGLDARLYCRAGRGVATWLLGQAADHARMDPRPEGTTLIQGPPLNARD